jgi:hypothetical protein
MGCRSEEHAAAGLAELPRLGWRSCPAWRGTTLPSKRQFGIGGLSVSILAPADGGPQAAGAAPA